MKTDVRLMPILRRGLRRRCPHCGRGALFLTWITLQERCADCRLKIVQNQGDTWAFMVFFDRIFLLAPIVAIYFGFLPASLWGKVLIFASLGLIFLITTPHRYGAYVALDYFIRCRWGDLSEKSAEKF